MKFSEARARYTGIRQIARRLNRRCRETTVISSSRFDSD